MSIEAMTWVLRHSEAKLGPRLVLIALADYAHADGSEAYPSVDTLCRNTRMSRRGVQAALRTLKADGEIVSDGVGRNGTTCYRLTMGGADSAPPGSGRGEADARGGRSSRREGGEAASPNPSKEPSKEPPTEKNARTRKSDNLPDDFPEYLKPHARRVFAILRDIAEQHNAREVTPRGIGLAIQGHPGRRFVGVAYELASWAQTPSRPIRDVVGTYRTFLDRAPTYAGIENFDAPPVGVAASAGNVHTFPAGGRGPSRYEKAQAGLAALHAQYLAEDGA